MRRLLPALLLAAATGCAPRPAPDAAPSEAALPPADAPAVHVDGAAAAVLAGVWQGTYESYDTGRVGDVYFALSDDGAHAAGEVAMVPRGATVDVRREGEGGWQWEGVARPQVLTIRFVRLPDGGAGREVVGELDPYHDPDCGCQMRTTFRGEVDGDTVNGTFASEAEHGGHDAEGTWYAVRR